MRFDDLDAKMRRYEGTLDLRFPKDCFMVARLDGRNFTHLTKEEWQGLEVPFDNSFNEAMVSTVKHLMRCGFNVIYGFTESDEISLLFRYGTCMFERKVRKYNSILAGEASAHFSTMTGHRGIFDCRMICLPNLNAVEDYFRWRQEDAHRNALNSHLYWRLRKDGIPASEAQEMMRGLSVEQKRTMLQKLGIDFDAQPKWQLRGVGVYFVKIEKIGFNPKTGREEIGWRNEMCTNDLLPTGDAYGEMVKAYAEPSFHRGGLREEMSRVDDNDRVEADSYGRTLRDLAGQCHRLSGAILNRMGWRVVKKVGKQMANTTIDEDFAKLGLNFFDQLSVYCQSRNYGEIMFGLEECVDDAVRDEMDNLSEVERIILDYRDLDALSDGEAPDRIFEDVKKEVSGILDQHYHTTRIRRFVERYNIR